MEPEPQQNLIQNSVDQIPKPIPANQNQTGNKKSKKKIIFIASIIVILLITIPSFIYLVKGKNLGDKVNKASNQSNRAEEKVFNLDPVAFENISVADWKNFEGKYVGISFKYPNGWFEKENEFVSQLSAKEYEERAINDENKISNNVRVRRYSDEVDSAGYGEILKKFNTLKVYDLNNAVKGTLFNEDDIGYYYSKVNEGKTSSGQSYYIYFIYDIDYENFSDDLTDEEFNTGNISNEKLKKILKPVGIFSYIKDKDALYELDLSNYDATGQNTFYSLVKSAKISKEPIPNKTFENDILSFEYSPYLILNENQWSNKPVPKTDIRLGLVPIGFPASHIYMDLIVMRALYLDPNKYGSGSYMNLNSWWNEAICRYLGEPFWYDGFSITNGYVDLFSNQDDSRGAGYDEYLVNKPYIVKAYSETQVAAKPIKLIISTLKFKAPKENLDSEMVAYLKDKSKSSQDIDLKCSGSTYLIQ